MDPTWPDLIPKDKKLLFIMEGLSFYLTEEENRKVISILLENFKDAEFYIYGSF